MSYLNPPRRALVIGRFLPPQASDAYLCAFAAAYGQELTLLIVSDPTDPIAIDQRRTWMAALAPRAQILKLEAPWLAHDDAPLSTTARSRFRLALETLGLHVIDAVFSAEPWGRDLADAAGARFVPVDPLAGPARLDSARVRRDPYAAWPALAAPVRADFLRRVTLFGAESTGKTTLAESLARRFNTVVASEYGRLYTETFGQAAAGPDDIRRIVEGHLAGVAAARPFANRVLIEDTDPVLTAIWSDVLTGGRDPWFATYNDLPDLYLLCDTDVPWAPDAVRYFADPVARTRFQTACEAELRARKAPWIKLVGGKEERLARAVEAVERLLAPSGDRADATP